MNQQSDTLLPELKEIPTSGAITDQLAKTFLFNGQVRGLENQQRARTLIDSLFRRKKLV